MKFLDDTTNRGSDARPSARSQSEGRISNSYQPGSNLQNSYSGQGDTEEYVSQNAGSQISPQPESYQSNNAGQSVPSNFEDSGYQSVNRPSLNPNFKEQYYKKQQGGFGNQAMRAINRARAIAQKRAPNEAKKMANDGQYQGLLGEQWAKEKAKEKAREFAKDKVGKALEKKLGKGAGRGFRKALTGDAGSALKKQGQKALQKATGLGKNAKRAKNIKAAKNLKRAGQVGKGVKNIKTGATMVRGGALAIGAATGPETLGLGFILGLLVNIAIGLGVEDAVEGAFKLKDGDLREARFLFVRAGAKVGAFIVFLLSLGLIMSVAGIIIGIPILFGLNVYMVLGLVFPRIAVLQGFVGWERIIIVMFDFMAFIIFAAFLAGVAWYICEQSGLGASGALGTAQSIGVAIVDWWNGSEYASTIQEMCRNIKSL